MERQSRPAKSGIKERINCLKQYLKDQDLPAAPKSFLMSSATYRYKRMGPIPTIIACMLFIFTATAQISSEESSDLKEGRKVLLKMTELKELGINRISKVKIVYDTVSVSILVTDSSEYQPDVDIHAFSINGFRVTKQKYNKGIIGDVMFKSGVPEIYYLYENRRRIPKHYCVWVEHLRK